MSRYLMVDGKRAKLPPERAKEIHVRASRRYKRRKLYNLTEERYQEMYEEQKGKCILPSCPEPATDIDHCHVYGVTRGLMCSRHNMALGLFNDSPLLLNEAADYLRRFYETVATE